MQPLLSIKNSLKILPDPKFMNCSEQIKLYHKTQASLMQSHGPVNAKVGRPRSPFIPSRHMKFHWQLDVLVFLKWEESLLRCYSRESCCLYLFLGRWQICSWTKGSWLKFPCSLSIKWPRGSFSRALTDLQSSAKFSGTKRWISKGLF